MPPSAPPPQNSQNTPAMHTMPQRQKGGMGATIGIVIIVMLILFGGLYFWGAHLNAQRSQPPPPLIPAGPSTQQ